jgi:hypothetical protein
MGLEFSRSFLAGGRAHGAPRAAHRRAGQWGLGAAAAGRGAAGCGYALYATRDSRSRIHGAHDPGGAGNGWGAFNGGNQGRRALLNTWASSQRQPLSPRTSSRKDGRY